MPASEVSMPPRHARLLLIGLLPALVLASTPTSAGASVIQDSARVIRSRHAGATFVQVDGCVRTEVFVSASDAMYGGRPGPVNKQGLVGVFVARRDACAEPGPKGYPLVWAADGVSLDRLSSTPQFSRAWVEATLPGTDLDGNAVSLALHLRWLPAADYERSRVSGNAWLPDGVKFGAHVHTFSHGLRADAVAWGTIAIGDELIALSPTNDAQLEQVRYFCQILQHPQGGAEVAC
jgi:hypothetical protein